jgi:hypothetical protein
MRELDKSFVIESTQWPIEFEDLNPENMNLSRFSLDFINSTIK